MSIEEKSFTKYWFTDHPDRRSNTGRTVSEEEMKALQGFLISLGMFPDETESRLDYAWEQLKRFINQRGKCDCCGSSDDGLTLGDLLFFMSNGYSREK